MKIKRIKIPPTVVQEQIERSIKTLEEDINILYLNALNKGMKKEREYRDRWA